MLTGSEAGFPAGAKPTVSTIHNSGVLTNITEHPDHLLCLYTRDDGSTEERKLWKYEAYLVGKSGMWYPPDTDPHLIDALEQLYESDETVLVLGDYGYDMQRGTIGSTNGWLKSPLLAPDGDIWGDSITLSQVKAIYNLSGTALYASPSFQAYCE